MKRYNINSLILTSDLTSEAADNNYIIQTHKSIHRNFRKYVYIKQKFTTLLRQIKCLPY